MTNKLRDDKGTLDPSFLYQEELILEHPKNINVLFCTLKNIITNQRFIQKDLNIEKQIARHFV